MKKFVLLAIGSSVIGALVLSFLFFNSEERKEEIILSTKINSKMVVLEADLFEKAPKIIFYETNEKGYVLNGEVWVEKIVEPESFFSGDAYEMIWVQSFHNGFRFWAKRSEGRFIYKSNFLNENEREYLSFFITRKIGGAWLENNEVKIKTQSQRFSLGLVGFILAWTVVSLFSCMTLWIVSDMRKAKKARESAPADAE